jgi:hypothetical protein
MGKDVRKRGHVLIRYSVGISVETIKKHREMYVAEIQIADPLSMKPLFPTIFLIIFKNVHAVTCLGSTSSK